MLCKPPMTVTDELFEADVVGRTRFYRCAEHVLSSSSDCRLLRRGISDITQPTRFDSTGTANTLDLLFCNDPCAVVVTDYLPPFSSSDHVMIEFSTFLPVQQELKSDAQPIKLSIYDWSAGDYEAITNALQTVDWYILFGHHFDAKSMWLQFKNIVWPLIDQFIPKKLIAHNKTYNPKAYPTFIKKLLTRKAAIWRILKINVILR